MPWTILKPATEVWANEWIKILGTKVLLPTGVEADFYMLGAPDGVAVLAIDDENCAILNRQFRPALGKDILELPAGIVENQEDHEETARRELGEESGFCAKELQKLGSFYRNPAKDTGSTHVYFARIAGSVPPRQEKYEHLETIRMPIKELITRVLNNEIQDVTTVFAVLMLRAREDMKF